MNLSRGSNGRLAPFSGGGVQGALCSRQVEHKTRTRTHTKEEHERAVPQLRQPAP